jgi:hypothetical protein
MTVKGWTPFLSEDFCAKGRLDQKGPSMCNPALTATADSWHSGRRSHQINQRLQNHVPGCSKMTRASGQLSRTIANIAPSSFPAITRSLISDARISLKIAESLGGN